MKIADKIRNNRLFPSSGRKSGKRGIALVTVLTIMSLTTILVLTFFSLANSERQASNTYSHGLQAQQVAEQAINMMIGQIRKATTVEAGSKINAWASQPGAIRVWDDDGKLISVYKLYSDETIVDDQAPNNTIVKDFSAMQGWSATPAQYVDLNEPVIRGEKVYYPIVHPVAADLPKWPKALGNDDKGVEGFRYNYDALHSLSDEGRLGAKAAAVSGAEGGHVAMPAKWIYQLADGSLGTLDASDKFSPLKVGGTASPTELNPIVARFAFWGDDETSKLNVNTHAGGLAWDVPKAGGDMDMDMGKYQPAQHEWQRYPGHPATTHLIPALAPGVLDIVNDKKAMELLFKIVPRIVGGGSESGTRLIDTRSKAEENGLIADFSPLFPTIDDILLQPDRTVSEFPNAQGRPLSEEELGDYLERAKFFITAVSRAPEVNLFNKPRVSIWPIAEATYGTTKYKEKLTTFDKLINYCASMGTAQSGSYPRNQYIFTRDQADSPTHDYNLPRNKELYAYLLKSLQDDVPGYGANFQTKYGEKSTRQLLTQIFDYIRSTNLHDDTVYGENFEQAFKTNNSNEHRTYTNWRNGTEFNKGFGLKGHGQVTPIVIDDTKGFGRFFTLSSAEVIIGTVADSAQSGPRLYPQYPGVRGYGGYGNADPSGGKQYANLPPLKNSVKQESPATWPAWLAALETSNPEEFNAAFDPVNWNWNLAFNDPAYTQAVLDDPTKNKFNISAISYSSGQLRLKPGETMVQSSFVFDLFCPSIGWSGINPDMEIHITRKSGMAFQGGAVQFLGFDGEGFSQKPSPDNPSIEDPNTYIWATNWAKPHREGGVRAYGGLMPFTFSFQARDVLGDATYRDSPTRNKYGGSVWGQLWNDGNSTSGQRLISSSSIRCRLTPLDRGYDKLKDALEGVSDIREIGGDPETIAQAYRYDLVTVPFKVSDTVPIDFGGGEVEFKIHDGGKYAEASAQDDSDSDPSLIQTIGLDFPSFSFPASASQMAPGRQGYVNEFRNLSSDSQGVLELASMTADPGNPYKSAAFSARMRGGSWSNSITDAPAPAVFFGSSTPKYLNVEGRMADSSNRWNGEYIHAGDIVRSVAVSHGDLRLVATRPVIDANDTTNPFQPHRDYDSSKTMAHSLTTSEGVAMTGFSAKDSKDYLIVNNFEGRYSNNPYRNRAPLPFATEKSKDVQLYGDFDNGSGVMIDGPYINKPDEGNVHSLATKYEQETVHHWEALRNYGEFPYFSNPEKAESGGPAYFSPNRLVSGPGVFGSLPTQAAENVPWQTLLFRPNVVGGIYESHPGAAPGKVPDHVIMDLFWMPVVEPYAISEPLSTAGKINMNYEIAPYAHIDRSTAVRGLFRSEMVLCIPKEWHRSYKHNRGRGLGYHWRDKPFGGELQGKRLRSVIVEDDTLEQFRAKFDSGDIFKSATEICDIHLITEEVADRLGITAASAKIGTYKPTLAQMQDGTYWSDHSLVGDNSRERPYVNIQQRLTTKSNTFRIHYRAQVLKQSKRGSSVEYETWDPALDTVQAEYRGSSIVERYIDPDDENVPDYASGRTNLDPIDLFYKYRVVNPRRFAP